MKITAPPGSVILFNASDLWHSGTFNYTPAARLALTAHFDPGIQPAAGHGSNGATGRSAVVSAAAAGQRAGIGRISAAGQPGAVG